MANKKNAFVSAITSVLIGMAFAFVLISSNSPSATATTTTTVTGWLIPDGTHWNIGIGALLFPLVGVGLMAGIAKVVEAESGIAVALILAGLTIGGVLAMLGLTASSTNVLPFALVVIPAADLAIWLWRGD